MTSAMMVARIEVVNPKPLPQWSMLLWKVVMPVTSFFGWPQDVWIGFFLNAIAWATFYSLLAKAFDYRQGVNKKCGDKGSVSE